MTSARRRGKSFIVQTARRLSLAVLSPVWVSAMAVAATTEWVVTDPRTGLAIDGFDPVAYFIDEIATVGRPDFEFQYRGVTWRFRNPGNQAAFEADPGAYEPRFGGYDPTAIARGAPTPGNPAIWLIWERKLYLFFDSRARAEFVADPQRMVMQADSRWPDILSRVLSQ